MDADRASAAAVRYEIRRGDGEGFRLAAVVDLGWRVVKRAIVGLAVETSAARRRRWLSAQCDRERCPTGGRPILIVPLAGGSRFWLTEMGYLLSGWA